MCGFFFIFLHQKMVLLSHLWMCRITVLKIFQAAWQFSRGGIWNSNQVKGEKEHFGPSYAQNKASKMKSCHHSFFFNSYIFYFLGQRQKAPDWMVPCLVCQNIRWRREKRLRLKIWGTHPWSQRYLFNLLISFLILFINFFNAKTFPQSLSSLTMLLLFKMS